MNTITYEWKISDRMTGQTIREGVINLSQEPREGNYLEIGEGDWIKIEQIVLREGKSTLLVC